MDIISTVKSRYTTKQFDPARKIPADTLQGIKDLLRLSPSSTNAQPWHFILAGSEAGKAKIAKATQGFYIFNNDKVRGASHVAVLCSKTKIDTAYLERVLDQEESDGRFADAAAREGQHKGRSYFVDLHRDSLHDFQTWTQKQTYIALGFLLLGAPALGVDACPIEGFDRDILNEELGLTARGLTASVIVALGYRADTDFNAKLPKSRLAESVVVEEI